jgi:hypothetical protein
MAMIAQVEITSYVEARWRSGEEAEELQEQWNLVHRRFGAQPHVKECCLADVCRAYEEATGTMTGCD